MKNFQVPYKGRILNCEPIPAPDGRWMASLYIPEHREGQTLDHKYFPDDGTSHATQEEAATVAEAFGKKILDEAFQQ